MSQNQTPYSPYRPRPKSQPAGGSLFDHSGSNAVAVGFTAWAIAFIVTALNAFVFVGTTHAGKFFMIYWVIFIASTLGTAVVVKGIKFIHISASPASTVFGWLGVNFAAEALFTLFFDSLGFPGGGGCCSGVFILLLSIYTFSQFAEATIGKAIICTILLSIIFSLFAIPLALVMISTDTIPEKDIPATKYLSTGRASEYAVHYTQASLVATFHPFTANVALKEAEKIVRDQQAVVEKEEAERVNKRQQEENARREAEQKAFDALPPIDRAFTLLNKSFATPAYHDNIRNLIRSRSTYPSAEFLARFTQLANAAQGKRKLLEITLDENASDLATAVFRALLADAITREQSDDIIKTYLFQRGLTGPQPFRAAYKASPAFVRQKLADTPGKDAIYISLLQGIAANETGAVDLVKAVLEIGSPQQHEKVYALIFTPNIKPLTVETIADHWSANAPDTYTPIVDLYVKIATSSSDSNPLDSHTIELLAEAEKPDRRMKKRIAELLLAAYRESPTPATRKALAKWYSDETRRDVIKSLMSVTTHDELRSKTKDLLLAQDMDIVEPLDKLLGIARAADAPSDELLDYLKTDTLRIEQILIDAIVQRGFQLPACEKDIYIMERIGWKKSRQGFGELYRSAKTLEARKRFGEAEAKVQRHIATTLRLFPNNNPDKPPFKPNPIPGLNPPSSQSTQSDDTPSRESASAPETPEKTSPTRPTPPPAVGSPPAASGGGVLKVAENDVIQITTLGVTDYAIVTNADRGLIDITLIKNDKKDVIGYERVVKILGTTQTPDLIDQLKAEIKKRAAEPAPAAPRPARPKPPTDDTSSTDAAPAPAYNPNQPTVGMKIEARKFEQWYDATIEKVGNNQCYVTFDGKGPSWNGWFSLADLRPKGSKKSFLSHAAE